MHNIMDRLAPAFDGDAGDLTRPFLFRAVPALARRTREPADQRPHAHDPLASRGHPQSISLDCTEPHPSKVYRNGWHADRSAVENDRSTGGITCATSLRCLFPFLALFTMGKVVQGVICLFFQFTLIGWLPADHLGVRTTSATITKLVDSAASRLHLSAAQQTRQP